MSETKIVDVQSAAGTLVLYDPAVLQGRVKASSTWWKPNALATEERKSGHLVAWPIGEGRAGTKRQRVRVGTALHPAEEPFLKGNTDPCQLVIEGDEIFVGPVERLPADGAGDRLPDLPDGGGVYAWEAGRYAVTVHVLDWQHEERFWSEDNEPTADAPADFIVIVQTVEGDLPAPPAEPQPLLEFIPKKTPLASGKVIRATRPKPKNEELKPKRGRASKKKTPVARASTLNKKVAVKARRSGELGVGAKVRHALYGVGEVQFMRVGFPKVKVSFHGGDYKVDKSELTVES